MQVALFDTECYPNYWLLKFRPIGQPIVTLKLLAGQSFSEPSLQLIRYLFASYTVISFNGINYDVAMITGALIGYTPEQLKILNDRIIIDGIRHWQLGLSEWKPNDHIDLMEVAPGAGSLKQYAGRIHSKKIQDLPYEPDHILSDSEIAEVELYCENDLDVLEDLWNALQPQIEQRIALSERYGIDLRSKSDAQLAETVLKHRCEQALGRKIYKPDINYNLAFKYEPPPYIAFELPQLQHAFNLVKESVFTLSNSGNAQMPPQLEGLSITIGNSTYRMGIGGLHSSEERQVCISDKVDSKLYRKWLTKRRIDSGYRILPNDDSKEFAVEYIKYLDNKMVQ